MKFLNLRSAYVFLSLLLTLGFPLSGQAKDSPSADKKVCPSTPGTDLVYPKNSKIQILDYFPGTDTYEANSPELPGEGNVDITFEALSSGIAKIRENLASTRHNPVDIVGETYVTDKAIPTLTEEELEARKNCKK